MITHQTYKLLEARFRRGFFSILSSIFKPKVVDHPNPSGMKKTLILQMGKIGDLILTTPIIKVLKKHYPGVKISLLTSPTNRDLVSEDTNINNIFVYDKNIFSMIKLMRSIRQERFDVVVNPKDHPSLTSLFFILFSSTKYRTGISNPRHNFAYNLVNDPTNDMKSHIIERNAQVLMAFFIDPMAEDLTPYISLSRSHVNKARDFLAKYNLSKKIKICFNLSAGHPRRAWGEEKWAELGRKILEKNGRFSLFLLTTSQDKARGHRIKRLLGDRVVISYLTQDIKEAAALVEEMDFLITTDTSIVHMASSFKIPQVVLYPKSKKNYYAYAPYKVLSEIILSQANDMNPISVEDVFRKFERLLTRSGMRSL